MTRASNLTELNFFKLSTRAPPAALLKFDLFKCSVLLSPCLWQEISPRCFSFCAGALSVCSWLLLPLFTQRIISALCCGDLTCSPYLTESLSHKYPPSPAPIWPLPVGEPLITPARTDRESFPDGITTTPSSGGWALVASQTVADQAPMPGLADEITTPECPGYRPGRLLQHVPRQAVALVLLRSVSTEHPVWSSSSLTGPSLFSLLPLVCIFISCIHLSLHKRDKRGFSDLISQWELFALESTYTDANWEQSSEWGPENCTPVNFLVGWFLLISSALDCAGKWYHDQLFSKRLRTWISVLSFD